MIYNKLIIFVLLLLLFIGFGFKNPRNPKTRFPLKLISDETIVAATQVLVSVLIVTGGGAVYFLDKSMNRLGKKLTENIDLKFSGLKDGIDGLKDDIHGLDK